MGRHVAGMDRRDRRVEDGGDFGVKRSGYAIK
jgi:hypothetical protein